MTPVPRELTEYNAAVARARREGTVRFRAADSMYVRVADST